jgi:hypothetical protein
VLKLIASQAAISLENTRLYGDFEEREARIQRLVEANTIGIFIWAWFVATTLHPDEKPTAPATAG